MEGLMTSTIPGQDANFKDGVLVNQTSAHPSLRSYWSMRAGHGIKSACIWQHCVCSCIAKCIGPSLLYQNPTAASEVIK